MTDSEAGEMRAAADVLRPALILWLVVEGVWGVYWLLCAWGDLMGPLAVGFGYYVAALVSCTVIGVFAWRDRDACRVFARPRPRMVELCLLTGIVGALLLAMWERALQGWNESPVLWERDRGFPFVMSLLTIAVVPAVFEELMYRGVMLQRLRAVLPVRLAICVQAMLFAVMHMDGALLLPHFMFGCLAGFLRMAARALWPCILFHFVWNAAIVLHVYGVV